MVSKEKELLGKGTEARRYGSSTKKVAVTRAQVANSIGSLTVVKTRSCFK